MKDCTSADQATKIKRRQDLRRRPFSLLATEPAADVAQQLETDIRVRIVTKVHAAKIERSCRHQICSSMIRISLHGLGGRRDFLVLTDLSGVLGIRRSGKRESSNKTGNENLE